MRHAVRTTLILAALVLNGGASWAANGGGSATDVAVGFIHAAAPGARGVAGRETRAATLGGKPVGAGRAGGPTAIMKQSQSPEVCSTSEEIFAAIAEERALLEAQRAEIAERRARLDLAREQLEAEAAQLAEVRAGVEGLLAQAEAARNEDLQRLVNLYRNMKPEDAAAIIDDLDMEATFMILANMTERDAAPILAELDPMRARALSRIFLERSQLPGDQDLSDLRLR